MARISVLGSGSWGSTLGLLAHRIGHEACVWGIDPEQIGIWQNERQHDDYLPGVEFPEAVRFTTDFEEALHQVDMILIVVPSHAVRPVAQKLATQKIGSPLIVNAAKGIENGTLLRMSQVLHDELPTAWHPRVCTLSGPSLAREVCAGIPTTVTVAGEESDTLLQVQAWLMGERFRVYTNQDIIGVELGGSLKNVIAIAAGTLDGLGFGDNTKGALITRGLAEMTRLGVAMGADPVTFAGLAGMGDLITTCESRQSRNRHVGEQLGKGHKLDDILNKMVMVAEGIKTAESARQLAQKMDVEMPLVEEVYAVLFEDKEPLKATADLMLREAKPEVW